MSAFLDGQVDDLRFGSIASSLDTYASELRCFLKFCRLVGAQPMPPSAATVQQFVAILRSPALPRSTLRLPNGHRIFWASLHQTGAIAPSSEPRRSGPTRSAGWTTSSARSSGMAPNRPHNERCRLIDCLHERERSSHRESRWEARHASLGQRAPLPPAPSTSRQWTPLLKGALGN